MTARFAPVPIGADVSGLPPGERLALVKMIEAARVLDGLYLRQVWGGNEALLLELLADRSPLGQARLHAFLVNKGPWSQPRPPGTVPAGGAPEAGGGGLLPGRRDEGRGRGMDAGAVRGRAGRRHLLLHDDKARRPTGSYSPCPTASSTRGSSPRAAELLREAAAATTQPTLRTFLEKRASAFLTNDYYASDVAWMELDATLEPTIGPYETYDDGWFGYKAAFEAFITVRDEKETEKLARFVLRAAVAGGPAAHRPRVPQPEARGDGPDPGGGRRVLVRPGQLRRPDRGLQPPERRAGGRREGQQARDAEEHADGPSSRRSSFPSRRSPSPPPTRRTWTSRPSSPTS